MLLVSDTAFFQDILLTTFVWLTVATVKLTDLIRMFTKIRNIGALEDKQYRSCQLAVHQNPRFIAEPETFITYPLPVFRICIRKTKMLRR